MKSKRHKMKILSGLILSGVCLALLSRGNSVNMPPNVVTASVDGQSREFEIEVMCAALRDGFKKNGLILGLHAALPRDDNDYQMLSTSLSDDGLFVSINEQRQLILYFGKESSGYEMTMPDAEFIADVSARIFNKDGLPVVDKLDTTIFITRLDESSDLVALEAITGSPFLSTVVKIIPLSLITNLSCDKAGTLGLGTNGTSARLDVGKIGKTSKNLMLRSIYLQRSVASLLVVLWLMSLWVMRKREDGEQADNVS